MPSRLLLLLLTAFWVVMNVLLWQVEYGARRMAGAPVPPQLIWRRMLTAPDASALTVFHHGQKIGFCQWSTSIGEELSRLHGEGEPPPEGMVRRIIGYHAHLEGNIALQAVGHRIRFDGNLDLEPDLRWNKSDLRLIFRPTLVSFKGSAREKAFDVRVESGDQVFNRKFRLEDLQNPAVLLQALNVAEVTDLARNLDPGKGGAPDTLFFGNLKWEGYEDAIRIGRSPVRAFRLQTAWLEKYKAVMFVSRVGELLRIELPDEIALVNDQLSGF
jgi:hypothetical protein